MPQESVIKSSEQARDVLKFEDLVAQVPVERREQFRLFVEHGEDVRGEFLSYLDEQAALPEGERGPVLNLFDQAFSRTVENLHGLGRALIDSHTNSDK